MAKPKLPIFDISAFDQLCFSKGTENVTESKLVNLKISPSDVLFANSIPCQLILYHVMYLN